MKNHRALVLLMIVLALALGGCGRDAPPSVAEAPLSDGMPAPELSTASEGETLPMTFEISSAAFGPGASIPRQYTCDGEDISPPLQWSEPPQGTQSFALIADDPDAPVGTWVHWVLYNLPASSRALPEAVPTNEQLPDGSRHGQNSWRRTDYGGPCPPGGTHRYFFKLYALDTTLDLPAKVTKAQLLRAMEGHILAQTEVMGTYSRQ